METIESTTSRPHYIIIIMTRDRDINIVLLLPLLQFGLPIVNAFHHCYPTSSLIIPKTTSSPPRSMFSLDMGEGGVASHAVAERPIEQTNYDRSKNRSYLGSEESAETRSIDDAKRLLLENIPYITAITPTDNMKSVDSNNDDDHDDDNEYYNYNNYNEKCRLVESNINYLESIYSPVQTIDFLNLVMVGEWNLLFSTNLLLPPPHLRRSLPSTVLTNGDETQSSQRLRLVTVAQKIEAVGYNGCLTNVAQWNYDDNNTIREVQEDAPPTSPFKESNSTNGSFSIPCTYTIHQGSRMNLQVSDDRQLRPAKIGSKVIIPDNVQELATYLRQSMPREIFDPSDHAMDITYMDADLRIVRYTGPNFEGVRNIFVRIPS